MQQNQKLKGHNRIVVIPDVGSQRPEDWKQGSQQQPWLKELQRRTCPNSLFFSFDYGFSVDDNFTWSNLLTKAEVFLETILVARRDYKVELQSTPMGPLSQLSPDPRMPYSRYMCRIGRYYIETGR